VGFVLAIPFLKLFGMLALMIIAIKLLVDGSDNLEDDDAADSESLKPVSTGLLEAVVVIVIADLTMSIDNVVALAAISQDSIFFLIFGLMLSVPLLMYGSLFVTNILKKYPVLIPAGGALLGWVAGDIGISDPLVSEWIKAQMPGFALAVPLACAIFVLLESRIIRKNMRMFPKPRLAALPSAPWFSIQSIFPAQSESRQTPVFSALPGPTLTVSEAGDTASIINLESLKQVESQASQPGANAVPFLWEFGKIIALCFLAGISIIIVVMIFGKAIYNGVINKSMLPQPTRLIRYECPGVKDPFDFYFKHGRDDIWIQSGAGVMDGYVHDGIIEWKNFSGGVAVLGFTPPQRITWDDAKSIRIDGGDFKQISCQKKLEAAPVK
jgi:YjbE family integral membrane protein